MLGAYIGFICTAQLGMGFFPALVCSMVVCALIGVVIERIAYKPLRNATRITALITAIGVSYFLEASTQKVMGTGVKTFPQVLDQPEDHAGAWMITTTDHDFCHYDRADVACFQFIVRKTKVPGGDAGCLVDADAARLMGVNVDMTISYTFAIGSALAGAAGVLVGLYYNSINPLMAHASRGQAFIAAVRRHRHYSRCDVRRILHRHR